MKVKQLEADNWLFNILYRLLEINDRLIGYSVKVYSTKEYHGYIAIDLAAVQ